MHTKVHTMFILFRYLAGKCTTDTHQAMCFSRGDNQADAWVTKGELSRVTGTLLLHTLSRYANALETGTI